MKIYVPKNIPSNVHDSVKKFFIEFQYTREMVQDMYNILERNGCINAGKKITFPSRAILLGNLMPILDHIAI